MKKIISLILCVMLLSGVSATAVNLEIDGNGTEADMVFKDGTAYVPLVSVAEAMGTRYSFDKKTQSAFVNGINLFPKEDGNIKVYVNGKLYPNTQDAFVRSGSVYLPAHLAADATGMDAKWYADTATLVFSKKTMPLAAFTPQEGKSYAIINLDTKTALTAGENSLSHTDYTKTENQSFRFIKTEFDGCYHIQSVQTGKNLDVNAHGTTPGVSIITWEMGTGDNQKFFVENAPGGTLISARSCHLPIEVKPDGGIMQNTKTLSDSQKWVIIPFGEDYTSVTSVPQRMDITYTPPVEDDALKLPFRTFSIGDMYLSDIDGLKAMANDNSDSFKWKLAEYSKDVYVIENVTTQKSLDVNARALTQGASIITWQTSRDTNQRWILEKNGDGSCYIKSVHSGLYLTLTEEGALIQQVKDAALKQRWTVTGTN
ncbi:MAG: RICIN domain-containing protein [Clostridia bacterium]|nr:RICIN domain-containing protein [Clostridia bacterium]